MTENAELDALVRRVCEHPADDVARLVYADWCDEHDMPQRAEFVRAQLELAKCGPPHHRFGYADPGRVELREAGPDYWTFEDWRDPAALGVKAGDRCDVLCDVWRARRGVYKEYELFGLLITRVTDRGNEGTEYVVKRDDRSGPWAGAELKTRCHALLHDNWPDGSVMNNETAWMVPLLVAWRRTEIPFRENSMFQWEWRRGFIDRVTAPLDVLVRVCCYCAGACCDGCDGYGWAVTPFAAELFRTHPVESVGVSDRTPHPDPESWFYWHPSSTPATAADRFLLPRFVFDAVYGLTPRDSRVKSETGGTVHYDTPDEARDTLSRAVVNMIRTRLDLPKLGPPP